MPVLKNIDTLSFYFYYLRNDLQPHIVMALFTTEQMFQDLSDVLRCVLQKDFILARY